MTRCPAYASGGYYRAGDPLENIEREFTRYLMLGFTDFKIKVGGAPLDIDVERVRVAREMIGPRSRLGLDANNAWKTPAEAPGSRGPSRSTIPGGLKNRCHPTT